MKVPCVVCDVMTAPNATAERAAQAILCLFFAGATVERTRKGLCFVHRRAVEGVAREILAHELRRE